MEARLIVSSKVFRKFLKSVYEITTYLQEDYRLVIKDHELWIGNQSLIVKCKGEGEFDISVKSVKIMINVLKHLSHQPISIVLDDSSSFKLNTVVI